MLWTGRPVCPPSCLLKANDFSRHRFLSLKVEAVKREYLQAAVGVSPAGGLPNLLLHWYLLDSAKDVDRVCLRLSRDPGVPCRIPSGPVVVERWSVYTVLVGP